VYVWAAVVGDEFPCMCEAGNRVGSKGGYRSVQVAMEVKSAVPPDHSTHTRYRIGNGDRIDESEVVDGTPDFYASSKI